MLEQFYERLKTRFQKKVGVSISKYSFLDQLLYAFSEGLQDAQDTIEKNKNPHIYTNLTGSRIDGVGMLVGCARYEDEDDKTYLARVLAHATANEASNRTAIESTLLKLKYSSNASYIPYTQGIGTATIHFIPNYYDETTIKNATSEIENRIKKVVSPDSYIKLEPSEPIAVRISSYAIYKGDTSLIENAIKLAVKQYINSIPIGETLSYGQLNRIGLNQTGVTYFNVMGIYLDNKKMENLEKMQTVKEKFIFESLHVEKVKE